MCDSLQRLVKKIKTKNLSPLDKHLLQLRITKQEFIENKTKSSRVLSKIAPRFNKKNYRGSARFDIREWKLTDVKCMILLGATNFKFKVVYFHSDSINL